MLITNKSKIISKNLSKINIPLQQHKEKEMHFDPSFVSQNITENFRRVLHYTKQCDLGPFIVRCVIQIKILDIHIPSIGSEGGNMNPYLALGGPVL